MTCVGSLAKMSMMPVRAGVIARLEATEPSELTVDAKGRACRSGHRVRKPSDVVGTTVEFSTKACALAPRSLHPDINRLNAVVPNTGFTK